MRNLAFTLLMMGMVLLPGCTSKNQKALNTELASLNSCGEMIADGFRHFAATRDMRFLGKVQEATAICRGGDSAKNLMLLPWVDWSSLYDEVYPPERGANHLAPPFPVSSRT
jgi:hypothetical protein